MRKEIKKILNKVNNIWDLDIVTRKLVEAAERKPTKFMIIFQYFKRVDEIRYGKEPQL